MTEGYRRGRGQLFRLEKPSVKLLTSSAVHAANSSFTDYHTVYPLLAHTNSHIVVDVRLCAEGGGGGEGGMKEAHLHAHVY